MLVTSIFSFSHNVFYPSKDKFYIYSTLKLSSSNAVTLDKSKILSYINPLPHNHDLTTLRKKPFENVGKGENASNQHFLPFPTMFLSCPKQILTSELHLICHLQMLPIWASLKFFHLGKSYKGLTLSQMTNFRLFQTQRVCRCLF